MATIPPEDLVKALKKIRDLRAWAVDRNINAWAVRQALITAVELDRQAARLRGVSAFDLANFDGKAEAYAREWVRAQGVTGT